MDRQVSTVMTVKVDLDAQTWEKFKYFCKKKDHKTVQGKMAEMIQDFVREREADLCRQS